MFGDVTLATLIGTARVLRSLRSDRGQTLAEYGLIMSIISIAVMLAAVFAFRDVLPGALESASECLDAAC